MNTNAPRLRLTTFERKCQVIDAILHHVDSRGYPPSMREIAKRIDVSLTRIAQLMQELVDGGIVNQAANTARGYSVNREAAALFVDRP